MTLQFNARDCNGILLRGFDISLYFHNWQVHTFGSASIYYFSSFVQRKGYLCKFHISRVNIKVSAFFWIVKTSYFHYFP